MTELKKIVVGDRVRVLTGSHRGEIATVDKVMWLSNQFGAYGRVSLSYEGGKVANRDMDSVQKVNGDRRSNDEPESPSRERS